MVLLDTHVWAWLTNDDTRLERTNKTYIQKAAFGDLRISAISVWEIAMLVHYGRLRLDRSLDVWIETSIERLGIGIIPLDAGIALESYNLPGDFHKDPADRMIMATARRMGLALVTQDKAILAYARKGHIIVAR